MKAKNPNAPRCPKAAELQQLIECYQRMLEVDDDETPVNALTLNALRYLQEYLTTRALLHKKQQIKKRIVLKIAKELGLDNEVDQAVEAEFAKYVSNTEPEPTEDEVEEENEDA